MERVFILDHWHNMDSWPLPLCILNGVSISTPYIIFKEPFSKYYLSLKTQPYMSIVHKQTIRHKTTHKTSYYHWINDQTGSMFILSDISFVNYKNSRLFHSWYTIIPEFVPLHFRHAWLEFLKHYTQNHPEKESFG